MFCPDEECGSSRALVLPYNQRRLICSSCFSVFKLEGSQNWARDYYAEKEWEKMASYLGKTYQEVLRDEYRNFSQVESV